MAIRIRPSSNGPTRGNRVLAVLLLSVGLCCFCVLHTSFQIPISTQDDTILDSPRHPDTTQQPQRVNVKPRPTALPRVLAIYFPQYHPDPLNDKNWGVNFTDWNNLKAAPDKNRLGFPIPRPTELGYYDLRDTETRRLQGQLAKEYGIDGFIYHHYWFYDPTHPGPNLAAPLLKMLKDGQPDMPFMFNWCAVRWSNVWMGKAIFQTIPTTKNRAIILQDQLFNATTDEIKVHYDWLAQFFHLDNYITIDNKPVFLLYTYNKLALPVLERLSQFARLDGFNGIHWIVGRSAAPDHIYEPKNLDKRTTDIMAKATQGLDLVSMEKFHQSMTYPYPLEYVTADYEVPAWCRVNGTKLPLSSSRPEITGIFTSFDNTPRREFESSWIYRPDSAKSILDRFRANLYAAVYFQSCCIQQQNDQTDDDRFVAINAWNEWAEGMSLEPSDVYGRGFLEIIRNVKTQVSVDGCSSKGLSPKIN